jgi:hypothetical protein
MIETSQLPLSSLQVQPFAEHPPGSILLLSGWRSAPAKLCLAVKIAGIPHENGPLEGAFILQGSPYGNADERPGELISDDDLRGAQSMAAWHGNTTVASGSAAMVDQSQQRSWQYAVGCVAVGDFGARILCGRGDGYRTWMLPVSPTSWQVDDPDQRLKQGAGLLSEWTLQIELAASRCLRLDVTTAPAPQSS